MSQIPTQLNLRKQFRIANCNFSLQSCKWKPVLLREKSQPQYGELPHLHHAHTKHSNPTLRLNQTAVLLSDHIYLFGGVQSPTPKNTFCAINLKNNRWHSLKVQSTPSPRDSHGLTVMQQQMYLFGGSDNSKYFNELYSFNTFTNQWKLIDTKGQTPSPRDPMAFLSIKNQALLLLGGVNMLEKERYLRDAFLWKNNEWIQLEVTDWPQALIMAKALEINGKIVVFGGLNRNTGQYNSDLYEIIIQENKKIAWKKIDLRMPIGPEGRVNHSLTRINNQYLIMIGGQQVGNKVFRDIWVYDMFLSKWSLIEPNNGPIKELHSFSSVMYDNSIYLMGGLSTEPGINEQVYTIEFANQEIFKAEICEGCISALEKKEQQNRKYPKDLVISVGFLYNMALEIKFPFHAVSMVYEAAKYFGARELRIDLEKTVNGFKYVKMDWDGGSFGKEEFGEFIGHKFSSLRMKTLTENLKLGSLRLGKTFLLISSDSRYRYTYLLSAESRITPHFDEAYIYYSYIENLGLQRIETEEGMKQRQLILNILKTYLSNPEIVLSIEGRSVLLIFEPRVMMSSEKEYTCELEGDEDDIRVWKNAKKVDFLEDRGYRIRDDLEISLTTWFGLCELPTNHAKDKAITAEHQDNAMEKGKMRVYLNESEQPVREVRYGEILAEMCAKGLIHKVDLPVVDDINFSGELYTTTDPCLIQNNWGVLIYAKGRLHSRLEIPLGQLFPQHFFKSKYKKARTIFECLGYINIESGLEENLFRNGWIRNEKWTILADKLKYKCEVKRRQIKSREGGNSEEEEKGEGGRKKVKV